MNTDEMTDDEMRVKIAELCGWELVHFDPTFEFSEATNVWRNPKGVFVRECFLPDYLNDLNAMHEAVTQTKAKQFFFREYQMNLFQVVCPGFSEQASLYRYSRCQFEMTEATARQRAIAFLKTKLA